MRAAKLLPCVQLFVTLWSLAHQAPLSMGFPRQEHQSGLPFPSPGDLPDLGIKLCLLSPTLAGEFLTASTTWEAQPTLIRLSNYLPVSPIRLEPLKGWTVSGECAQGQSSICTKEAFRVLSVTHSWGAGEGSGLRSGEVGGRHFR